MATQTFTPLRKAQFVVPEQVLGPGELYELMQVLQFCSEEYDSYLKALNAARTLPCTFHVPGEDVATARRILDGAKVKYQATLLAI